MSFGLQKLVGDSGMERKRIDDYEPGPIPSPKPLDRFGFIKQEFNTSPEGLSKSRTANDHERYAFFHCFFSQLNIAAWMSIIQEASCSVMYSELHTACAYVQ